MIRYGIYLPTSLTGFTYLPYDFVYKGTCWAGYFFFFFSISSFSSFHLFFLFLFPFRFSSP